MRLDQRHMLLIAKINDIMNDIDLIEAQLKEPNKKRLNAARKNIWLAGAILTDKKGAEND